MSHTITNEYHLEVGTCTIGIRCPSGEYAASLADYFGFPDLPKEPDILIHLNIVLHEDEIQVPDSLFTAKKVYPGGFEIAGGIVRGKTGPAPNEIQLWVKKGLTIGMLARVFEQLLYQAFYSCRKIKQLDSLLVHCTGIVYHSDGFLFVGPSGSGKSTIASLSSDYHVLNDEICLLEFRDGTITLHGTPFNGYFKAKKPGAVPLKAVFLIRHGTAHLLSEAREGEAVPLLAKEIVPPVALDEAQCGNVFIGMLDTAERIFRTVPVYVLEFLPDGGFWREIDRQFYRQQERSAQ